jgi:hypothetical protein
VTDKEICERIIANGSCSGIDGFSCAECPLNGKGFCLDEVEGAKEYLAELDKKRKHLERDSEEARQIMRATFRLSESPDFSDDIRNYAGAIAQYIKDQQKPTIEELADKYVNDNYTIGSHLIMRGAYIAGYKAGQNDK